MPTSSRRARLACAFACLVLIALPAQAIEFFCSDVCSCWMSCTFRCTDDNTGFRTTCGSAGYPCGGACARAEALTPVSPLEVALPAPSDDRVVPACTKPSAERRAARE